MDYAATSQARAQAGAGMSGAGYTVPPQRMAGFKVVANATRSGKVLVICKVEVEPQYLLGVAAAGGIVENVVFLPSRRRKEKVSL